MGAWALCVDTVGTSKWSRVCVGCGVTFEKKRKTKNENGNKGLYCSRECAFRNKRQWGVHPKSGKTLKQIDIERSVEQRLSMLNAIADGALYWLTEWQRWVRDSGNCIVCGKPMSPDASRDACSGKCEWLARTGWIVRCVECNCTIDRRIEPNRRYCGDCRKERLLAHRKRARVKEKVKRRRLVKATTVESVVSRLVFERDEWVCWICKEECSAVYDCNDPMSPTLDHVTPLAKGGEHTYANIKTAHAWCNTMKSDGAVEAVRQRLKREPSVQD